MSELNELAAALAKAQGEIVTIQKDSDNPYFKSKYASLPAVREAVREAFARHGLSVVQIPEVDQGRICLHTLLLHSSGQQLNCGTLSAEVDLGNPQKMGSCLTYFRRYSLAAISQCVADDGEDDDGNAASAPSRQKQTVKLTGHDVVKLQGEINDAPTTEALSAILHGDTYKQLKSTGPEDVYQQTAKLAKAKHTLLTTPITGDEP
jgi:hypothetical protein